MLFTDLSALHGNSNKEQSFLDSFKTFQSGFFLLLLSGGGEECK